MNTSQLTPEQIAELRTRIGRAIEFKSERIYVETALVSSLLDALARENNANLNLMDAVVARDNRIADQEREIDSLATVAGRNTTQVKELTARAESAEQALLLERQKETVSQFNAVELKELLTWHPTERSAAVDPLLLAAMRNKLIFAAKDCTDDGISLQKGDD
jgi:hypothetical protein